MSAYSERDLILFALHLPIFMIFLCFVCIILGIILVHDEIQYWSSVKLWMWRCERSELILL